MTPTLSLITAYYNRRASFINVLKSISKSKYKNEIEFVVTDDASDPEHKINDVPAMFPDFPIRIIEVKKEDKWWYNPCVAFNMAIRQATGKITIINSAEVYHVTDIIAHTIENLKHEDYFTFKVFALTEAQSKDIEHSIKTVPFEEIKEVGGLGNYRQGSWYNHPIHKPSHSYFLSAIHTDVLQNDLNGCDERFAKGWGFDDNEFFTRVLRRKLNVSIPNDQLALHQWHNPWIPTPGTPMNDSIMNTVRHEHGKIRANDK